MTTFLQVIILFALASVAILIIYLIDRVNNLQRYTRLLQPNKAEEEGGTGPFGELSGQKLWDAVSGVPPEGWDKTSIDLIRNRYQLVLRKHLEELFLEGLHNAQAGTQSIPLPSRVVQTLRGPVESWIPIESAIAIHKAGAERARCQESDLPKVRKALDDATLAVFAAAGMQLNRPMSDHLIPLTEAERSALQAVNSAAGNAAALVASQTAMTPPPAQLPAAPTAPALAAPNGAADGTDEGRPPDVGAALSDALAAAIEPRKPSARA